MTISCLSISGLLHGLLHDWWRFKGVIGRRRGQGPLQCFCTLPWFLGRLCSPADALQYHIEEQQLGHTESKCSNTGNHIEVRKLQRIVGNTARHAGKPQEVLDE